MLYYDQTPCNIIGRISMDLIGVDVSNCGENPDHLWLLNDINQLMILLMMQIRLVMKF